MNDILAQCLQISKTMVDIIQTQAYTGQTLTRRAHFDSERMAGTVPVWETGGDTVVNEPEINDRGLVLPSRDISNEVAAGIPPSLSFGEFLDVINPLQHIPVVGDFYRQFTGDEISPVARIIGGGIYGGPIGFVASIANAAIEEHSGKTLVDNIMTDAFTHDTKADDLNIQMSDKKMPPPAQRWHFNT